MGLSSDLDRRNVFEVVGGEAVTDASRCAACNGWDGTGWKVVQIYQSITLPYLPLPRPQWIKKAATSNRKYVLVNEYFISTKTQPDHRNPGQLEGCLLFQPCLFGHSMTVRLYDAL